MNKRLVFLASAIVLLGLGAWLMPSMNPSSQGVESDPPGAPPRFPTGPTPADQAKIDARKTLPVAPVALGSAGAGAPRMQAANPARRDALLVALPPSATDVIVMEAQTFLDRPLVRGITMCLRMESANAPLDALGLRTADLDRVALADLGSEATLAVVSGAVNKLDVTHLLKNTTETRYGDHGRVFESHAAADPAAQHASRNWVVASWQDAIVLLGKPRAVVEQAIDRLEGRAESDPLFAESQMYGDAYGRVGARTVRRIMPDSIAEQIERSAMSIDVHMDAKKDLLLVADATGQPELSQSVGKAAAAGLAAKRVQAATDKDKTMVKLLDLFRVSMTKNGFRLQAGFTERYLRDQLGACFIDGASPKGQAGSGG